MIAGIKKLTENHVIIPRSNFTSPARKGSIEASQKYRRQCEHKGVKNLLRQDPQMSLLSRRLKFHQWSLDYVSKDEVPIEQLLPNHRYLQNRPPRRCFPDQTERTLILLVRTSSRSIWDWMVFYCSRKTVKAGRARWISWVQHLHGIKFRNNSRIPQLPSCMQSIFEISFYIYGQMKNIYKTCIVLSKSK